MANALGRGLSSLIPDRPKQNTTATNHPKVDNISKSTGEGMILRINPKKIKPNPKQPRKYFSESAIDELANSIKEFGILQPLVVASSEGEEFELIAGERRLRAALKAGLKEVPAVERIGNELEKLQLALIENIQRENLNPIETAMAYQNLVDDFSLKQEQLAKKVGKPRSSVANTLRFLRLPEEIKNALAKGDITEGHAKYLLGLDNEVKQLNLFRKIIHNGLNVGDTAREFRRAKNPTTTKSKINYRDKDKEFAFREFFGARVRINRKARGGEIVISFYDDEELEEIVGKVKG